MSHPAYIRSDSESTFHDAKSTSHSDSELHQAGLRRKKLCALFTCLILLTAIAVSLLVVNLMIITALQMDTHGMRFLRFHSVWNPKTKEKEKVVQFSGNEIDLGSVIVNSGKVGGQAEADMDMQGSRVIIKSEEERGARLILQENGCKFEQAEHFQIVSTKNGRPIFSARHPLVSIDKRIKRLSTQKIITNKIRSPVDESLSIAVDNLSFRGNEAVRMDANNIKLQSPHQIYFNTSLDGAIHFHGRVSVGDKLREFPLSQSPALSASIDAFRVCICSGGKPKLFLVPGNKPCQATFDIC